MNYAAVGRLPQPLCVAQQHPNLVYGSMRRKHWYLNQTRVSHTSVRWRALDLVRGKGLPALICLPSPFGRAGRLDWTAVFAAPPGEGEGGGLGESLVRTPSSGEVCVPYLHAPRSHLHPRAGTSGPSAEECGRAVLCAASGRAARILRRRSWGRHLTTCPPGGQATLESVDHWPMATLS